MLKDELCELGVRCQLAHDQAHVRKLVAARDKLVRNLRSHIEQKFQETHAGVSQRSQRCMLEEDARETRGLPRKKPRSLRLTRENAFQPSESLASPFEAPGRHFQSVFVLVSPDDIARIIEYQKQTLHHQLLHSLSTWFTDIVLGMSTSPIFHWLFGQWIYEWWRCFNGGCRNTATTWN